jgi:mannose-6-phosphate isomerase-like protein (cupin superfamily)
MKQIDISTTIKPWGKEEIVEENVAYVVKRLTMKAGHRCSLQYHELKRETIYVLSGVLKISIGIDKNQMTEDVYYPNSFITIEPLTLHRMEGIEDTVYLEASTTEIHDVVRLEDDYNRG